MSNSQGFQPQMQIPPNQHAINQLPLNYQMQPNLKEQINTSLFTLKKLIDSCDVHQLTKYLKSENIAKQSWNDGLALITNIYSSKPEIYQMYSLLLNSGADVDSPIRYSGKWTNKIQDKDNITLLMFSIIINDLTLFKIAYDHRPNFALKDANNRTALMLGLIHRQGDDISILGRLIKNKNDVNTSCYWDWNGVMEEHSAFTFSCFYGLSNITKFLVENGADVYFKTSVSRDTGLHIAVRNGSVDFIRLILDFNMDWNARNNEGKRPLDEAQLRGKKYFEVVLDYYKRNGIEEEFEEKVPGIIENNANANEIGKMNNVNMQTAQVHDNGNMQVNDNMIQYYQMNNHNNTMPQDKNNNMNMNANANANMNNLKSQGQKQPQPQQLQPFPIPKSYSMKQPKKTVLNSNQIKQTNTNSEMINTLTILELNAKSNASSYWDTENSELNKYSLEIPISIKPSSSKTSSFNDLDSHIQMTSSPCLTLDITDESFQLELEWNSWTHQLEEIQQKLNISHKANIAKDAEIEKCTQVYDVKVKELDYLKTWENDQSMQIEIKSLENRELMAKIPEDKYFRKTNKSWDTKSYHECKFTHSKCEEPFIISELQKDLLDYQQWILGEFRVKNGIANILVQQLQNAMDEVNLNHEAKIFGSFATGLCWPWSDLDIVLINKAPNTQVPPQSNPQYILQLLFHKWKTLNWVVKCQINETSWSPVLVILTTENFHGITIVISYQDENHFGLKSASLVMSYLKEYKVLQPIMFALKTILKNANWNIADAGGWSSYGWILMVVSYIQSQSDGSLNFEEEEFGIGKTFYYFLGHYGIYFDFNKYLIITYPWEDNNAEPMIDNETSWNFWSDNLQFIIVDPLNKHNNVAKNTFQFMNLKMAFMIAYMVTKEDCECGCHYGKAIRENSYTSVEHCIWKRMFNSVKRFSDSAN